MSHTSNRARAAHGISAVLAASALATSLLLAPAGAANAMPRFTGSLSSTPAAVTTHHARPMPRLRMSPNPKLFRTPYPRLYKSPYPRLYVTPNPRLLKSPYPRLWSTPNLRMR